MSFSLAIPSASGGQTTIDLGMGQTLFVLGANGTGKSSLLQRFSSHQQGSSRRISASRQTWFQSSAIEFSPSQKHQFELQARNWDNTTQSRWMEQNASQRSGLTLYDLIDAENVDARAISGALRAGRHEEAEALARETAPIDKINELLALSNIPIKISVEGGDRLVASKNGGASYGAAELSDGERNALLIAADVLTAKLKTLLIIDEPERHLHRSIISPLLTQLFSYRKDCAFIVATHDLMLPIDNPSARVLLLRSCSYSGQNPSGWDIDLLPANTDIDENLKKDIVGARRKIAFVEGRASSLDKPLYSVLFPAVSVRPKGSSRDVEQAVLGIRSSQALHWVRAWGVIDNDGRDPDSIIALGRDGVFALPFHSIESIYYHPYLISALAYRHAKVIGGDGQENTRRAIQSALDAVKPHLPRLAARAVEKSIRHLILSKLPTLRDVEQKEPVNITVDVAALVDAETVQLAAAVDESNWVKILTRCPIRETPALDSIARTIGFRDRQQYEHAVVRLLMEDADAVLTVRALFGGLAEQLLAA